MVFPLSPRTWRRVGVFCRKPAGSAPTNRPLDTAPDGPRHRLAPEGVELLTADGGAAGLEAAAREQPDLILLDLDMPDMSGFDVCRALKADAAQSPEDLVQQADKAMYRAKTRGRDRAEAF